MQNKSTGKNGRQKQPSPVSEIPESAFLMSLKPDRVRVHYPVWSAGMQKLLPVNNACTVESKHESNQDSVVKFGEYEQ